MGITLADVAKLIVYVWWPSNSTTDTVANSLKRLPEPVRIIAELLCLAALNTEPDKASAKVFKQVLKSAFFSVWGGSDTLIPKVDLSACYPEQLKLNGQVRLGEAVVNITHTEHYEINTRKDQYHFRQLILAVAPQHLPRLLKQISANENTLASAVETLHYEPISTVTARVRDIPPPFSGLRFFATTSPIFQWLFIQPQSVKCVVSGGAAHANQSVDTLKHAAAAFLTDLGFEVCAIDAVTEKRASYSCTPAQVQILEKLQATLLPPNAPPATLHVCGDYTYPYFPATLEAAVRSGKRAALAALSSLQSRL
ncbi:MAG: hypothetical protein RLZZ502_786 [Pseudomonadota bacterium]